MPQLNPTPWFSILLLSWASLLIVFKMKILLSTHLNNPLTLNQQAPHTTPWAWPWT